MANSADQVAVSGNDMALALNAKSMDVISTVYSANTELAWLNIHQHKKPEAVLGIGDPDPSAYAKGAMFGNAKYDPIKIREAEQVGTYSPLVQTMIQEDTSRGSYRDTSALPAAHSGTDATITLTITAGVITGTTISNGGTGFSGAAPTLYVVNAPGSAGYGADLVATVSGGVITAVTINSGGRGYAASGNTVMVYSGKSFAEQLQRPIFKWARLRTVGTVFDDDVASARALMQALPDFEEGDAELSLASDAMVDKVSVQAGVMSRDLWYGNPTVGNTDSAKMYDQPFGFIQAVDDSNVYGGVDRSLAANWWWRAKVDAAPHPGWGFSDLVEDSLQDKGLAYKNGGPDVFFVPPSLIKRFKRESISYSQNVNIQDDIREMGKYGFKAEVLQYGNTYAVGTSRCPEGTVIGLNHKAVMILFRAGFKFNPSELKSQKGVIVGGVAGIEGSTFTVETQWMPMIVAPELCIKYTGIS